MARQQDGAAHVESRLDHVVAIITGAAGGIGREMVFGLLARGARVLAADIDERRLGALYRDAPVHHRELVALHCADLDADGAERATVDAAVGAFGAVNALVCNSGLGRAIYTKDLLQQPPRAWEIGTWAWERMFQTNVLSPIRLANAAVPRMLDHGWGRIVTVTTSLDHMLSAGSGPYGPSKAALEAYSSVLARELQGSGTTVNVVVPGGVVDTPMVPELDGISRTDMLSPRIMVPPLAWLLSRQADAVNGRRVRARLWDESLDPPAAFEGASASVGWWDIAAGQQRAIPGSPQAQQ